MKSKRRYQFREAQKIKRKKEISGLFKSSEKWRCAWCSIYYSENEMNRNRCVIIVPKTFGTAVERNKIKRHAREYFRKYLKSISLPVDILIKIHSAKEANNGKNGLEKALALWSETLKK